MVTRCRYDSSRKKTLGLHREHEELRKQHLSYLLRKTGPNETTTKTDRTRAQGEGVQRSLHRVESAMSHRTYRLSWISEVPTTNSGLDRKKDKKLWRNGESNARPFQDKLMSANGMLYQLNHIPIDVDQILLSYLSAIYMRIFANTLDCIMFTLVHPHQVSTTAPRVGNTIASRGDRRRRSRSSSGLR
jgi:hypothetical protein